MILHPNIKYRSDIDGLRALAVLSVILFHINAEWIPGGFLGVDIFFVISGYLITLILTKEVEETNKLSIVNFYKRRIKRIVPALLFVLIPTFIAGFLFFVPDDLLALSESIIWSFFSAANIYFFASIDTGYFATGSSELPLLHLWSLGVEEQFYILWPFAVLFLLKYVSSIKKRILIASLLFAGSLVWAQSIIVTDHSFAYYMLFTRAWELLAGAIAALLVHSGFRTKSFTSEIMAVIGLLAIIVSLIFVSESDPVPGIAALPVIIGATLLVLSGTSHQTIIGRILSLKILVAIGLVSYSAYLWHWPILAYLRYALIEIDWAIAIVVILSTFTMATVSYFFIETPLRKNNIKTKSVFLWYFIVPGIAVVSISMLTIKGINNKSTFIFPWEKLDQINSGVLPTEAYQYNCNYSISDSGIFVDNRCIFPEDTDKANVFLVGDSNAAHYLGMLRVFAKKYGFGIRNATRTACPLVSDGGYKWIDTEKRKGCSQYRQKVFIEALKYDTVIIGLSWNYYYSKKGFTREFEKMIDKLSKNINHIILLGKVPIFSTYNKECEARSICLSNLDCSTYFDNKLQEDISNHWLRKIAKKYSNIEYFDIRKQLCKNNKCSPYLNSNPVYYDSGHLSMTGSEKIGNSIVNTDDSMLQVFEYLENQKQTYRKRIAIDDHDSFVDFIIKPESNSVKIAFYLYKNNKRIDTQWYSKNFSYRLDKKKYEKGKYKIRYFVIKENAESPGKAEKLETGESKQLDLSF